MISHDYKCIFIHIPKCAGTSLEHAFGHYGDFSGRGGHDHRSLRMIEPVPFRISTIASESNARELYRRWRYKRSGVKNPLSRISVTQEQFNTYFKFTLVRNPWSRAHSWYKNVMRDEIHRSRHQLPEDFAFEDFLQRFVGIGALRTQTYWLKNFAGKVELDFIGKFENLETDFQTICEKMGVTDLELPHKIKGSGEDYRQAYTDKTIKIVGDFYQEEIELFGYTFDH